MYRITKTDGTELGMTDAPIYIKIGASGSFAPTDAMHAIGVAFQGEPYNLAGHEEIDGADTVVVTEYNGGETIAEQQRIINDLLISILEG